MIKLSKPFYLKLLFCTIFAMFCAVNIGLAEQRQSEPLFNTSKTGDENKKTMKNMHWSSPKPKEKIEPKETPAEASSEDKEQLTPEETLWKKYKDLAAGTQTKSADEEDTETNASEPTKEKSAEEKKPGGIDIIIKDYKDAQKGKGKMNSRSFGSID